jgi:DNA transformation protein
MDGETLKDLFAPFGAVVVKRMFGGHGIYFEGLVFAVESNGEVYLKTDGETEPAFAAAGSAQFVYQGHSRPVKMSFWRLVADAYDDAEELRRWSGLAMQAARRAAQAKAGKVAPDKAKRSVARAKSARRS